MIITATTHYNLTIAEWNVIKLLQRIYLYTTKIKEIT